MRGEKSRLKKASYEQKEYLLAYMEENPDFANDRFTSSGGARSKTHRWRALATRLNEVGGATKDENQWRKYWRDQKLHSKEREALIKASYQNTKPLSDFEKRLIALISPAAAEEMCQPDVEMPIQVKSELDEDDFPEDTSITSSMGGEEEPMLAEVKSEVGVDFPENAENSPVDNAVVSTATDDRPIAVVEGVRTPEARRTPRVLKRQNAPASGMLQLSLYERKLLSLKRAEHEWKKEYEKKMLELKEKELLIQEREMTLREKEFEWKTRSG